MIRCSRAERPPVCGGCRVHAQFAQQFQVFVRDVVQAFRLSFSFLLQEGNPSAIRFSHGSDGGQRGQPSLSPP